MDFASQREKQTGAVFDLGACPFVLYSHVWRHANITQSNLYAETRMVTRRVAGALIGAGWVGLCGCGVISGVRRLLFHVVNQLIHMDFYIIEV